MASSARAARPEAKAAVRGRPSGPAGDKNNIRHPFPHLNLGS